MSPTPGKYSWSWFIHSKYSTSSVRLQLWLEQAQINHFSIGKRRALIQSMGKCDDNSDYFSLFFTGEPLEFNITLDMWEGM